MNMRKLFLLLFVFLCLCLCLCSCNTDVNNGVSISEDKEPSFEGPAQCNSIQNCLSSINILYKQGKNYEILSDESLFYFHYFIRDNDGRIIDEGYHGPRGSFDIIQKETYITLNYGHGGNSWFERYYDVSAGRLSRFFESPIQTNDELVALFKVNNANNDIILVIQNIFDPDKYYKEVMRDFSDLVIKDEVKAEFLDDNTKLRITYWTNPDNEEITEIIMLE